MWEDVADAVRILSSPIIAKIMMMQNIRTLPRQRITANVKKAQGLGQMNSTTPELLCISLGIKPNPRLRTDGPMDWSVAAKTSL